MNYPVYIVDEIKAVVEAVSAALLPSLIVFDPKITGVHYLHGHPKEIIETLNQKGKTNKYMFEKYPLVALFQDFPEVKGELGFDSTTRLHLIIARATRPEYKATERYDKNFKPVLYPIYQEFLKQLSRSKAFLTKSQNQISHEKTDRLYWGREGLYGSEANIFNDFIDCIEIRDLELKVNLKNCNK